MEKIVDLRERSWAASVESREGRSQTECGVVVSGERAVGDGFFSKERRQ